MNHNHFNIPPHYRVFSLSSSSQGRNNMLFILSGFIINLVEDHSGDYCDVISYGATREDEEDSVSISSRFLINITAIIAVITVINKTILMNMLKPLCCIITL